MAKELTDEQLREQDIQRKKDQLALQARRAKVCWYVLYCKPNHERKLAEIYNNMEHEERAKGEEDFHIEAYVPCRKVKRKWSDRVKVVEQVLTPGIVFVRLALTYQPKLYVNSSAIRGLMYDKVKREPVPIPLAEMNNFRIMVDGEVHISMHDPQPGMKVRIEQGQFRGFVGTLIRYENDDCFQIRLNEQMAFSFKIKRTDVVAADDTAERIIIDE